MSASVLRLVGAPSGIVQVSGLPWLKGETRGIPVPALGSNVLCERHNNRAEILDRTANRLFTSFAIDRLGVEWTKHRERHLSTFTLCNGIQIERWLLKVFLGGMAAKQLSEQSRPRGDLSTEPNLENLLNFIWRGSRLPNQCGLYSQFTDSVPASEQRTLQIRYQFSPEGRLEIGEVNLGGIVRLVMILGIPENLPPVSKYRPAGYVLQSHIEGVTKCIALAWPEKAGPFVRYIPSGANTRRT